MSETPNANPLTWPRWAQITAASVAAVTVGAGIYYATRPSSTPAKPVARAETAQKKQTTSGAPQQRPSSVSSPSPALEESTSSTASRHDSEQADDEQSAQKAKANSLRKQGNDAYKARRFDEAITAYTKALETSPVMDEDCAVYYCNRAACFLFQKKYDKVIEDCTAALRLRPLYTKALNRRAQAYENKGKLRNALKDYTTIVLIDKFENEAASKAVERLLEVLGRRGAAKYLEDKPKQLPSKKVMISFFDNFQPTTFGPIETESISTLEELVKSDQKSGDLHARLCKAYLREREFQKAYDASLKAFDRLQEMNLDDARKETLVNIMNIVGCFQMLRLELQEAEKTFTEAVRFSKRNANTLLRLAACRLELGKTNEALAEFTNAQRIDDQNADVYFHKAQAHISMGAAVMAFSDLQRAIKLDSQVYGPYVHLALLHLQTQDPDTAISLMEQAAKKFPENSTVRSYLGEIYFAVGDAAKALECFDKAIELDPSNANPYVHKGMVEIQKGNLQGGLDLINQAVQVDDKCESAYARLAQIHVQREEYDKALECYDKAIEATHAGQELVAFFSCKEACVAQQSVVKAHPDLRPTEVPLGSL